MLLFISHDASRTGAPIALLHLMRWMRANTDHQLALILKRDGALASDFAQVAHAVVMPSHPWGPYSGTLGRVIGRVNRRLSAAQLLRRGRVRSRECDLIYSNTCTNGELVNSLITTGVPVITHAHELSYVIREAGTRNWSLVKDHTSRFIAVAGTVKANLVDKFSISSDLVDVVHGFVGEPPAGSTSQTIDVRKELGIPEGAFILGGSGQGGTWRKGTDLFIQLAQLVQRRLPERDVHFMWVGNTGDADAQERLHHDARAAGLWDRIHWTGEVRNPEPYFSEFDVFAMVSREDPFPMVCLEVALFQKPIVCFQDAGGTSELVESDAGFVVAYLDLIAAADRIAQLARDPDVCHELGRLARAKVMERHTANHAGPRILEIIESEIARHRRQS